MNLSPLPIQKFFDNAGRPLNGGLLFTYGAGTTTKLATYQDQAGVPNTNPVVLNFRGEANVWLDQTLTYKFVLSPEGDTDPPTRPIWSVDNISAAVTFASLSQQIIGRILWPQTQAERDANVTPTDYGYPPGNILRYGANPNGIADSTEAIQAAVDQNAEGGADILVPVGIFLISETITGVTAFCSIFGVSAGGSVITTALDIEMFNLSPAGAYNVTFRDLEFSNTYPVSSVDQPTFTATTTNGSPTLTVVSSLVGLDKGAAIRGLGVPAGTYIRKISAGVIYMCDSVGNAVNATASAAAVTITPTYRVGQSKYHLYLKNAGWGLIDRCRFLTAFIDTDYAPTNAAGVWFDRNLASYWINTVTDSWFVHCSILMGTSDSNIKNNHVWGNATQFAVKIAAPGNCVSGNNLSAGQKAALWVTATGSEPFGANNHNFSVNNIDGGGIFYSGYGMLLETPGFITTSGNRINQCFKAGIYMSNASSIAVGTNEFLDNNLDGLAYSDIELDGIIFGCNRIAICGNSFAQSNAKSPTIGWAIREINSGAVAALCSYVGNTVTDNYNDSGPNGAFSVATPVGPAYPRIVGNSGGNTQTETFSSATLTLSGCTTAPTVVARINREGNDIQIYVPAISATSNSTSMKLAGIPAAFLPANTARGFAFVLDNGAAFFGAWAVDSSGDITLYLNNSSTGFTAAGTKGVLDGLTLLYPLL